MALGGCEYECRRGVSCCYLTCRRAEFLSQSSLLQKVTLASLVSTYDSFVFLLLHFGVVSFFFLLFGFKLGVLECFRSVSTFCLLILTSGLTKNPKEYHNPKGLPHVMVALRMLQNVCWVF